ncbi:histone H1.1, embryonic-like [Galleria mellonella]|uniref:Histone H1.1, embryonic-like n=1 Tax=Galleria mellonella TaxID=7137 RepID=A0A6J1WGW8_GALME|nr:histone H1.1, embryonic-like [Galleria mellonella]
MSESSDDKPLSALVKKTKNTSKPTKMSPRDILKKNQDEKKLSTKIMVHEALNELKSRKGTSLHAIKKYITEKYNVDTDKINYLIKKFIKTGVETGTIVQMKGVGASGSFKLVTEKKEKKPEEKKTATKTKSDKEKSKTKEKKEVVKEKKEDKKKIKPEAAMTSMKDKVKKSKTEKRPESKKAKESKVPPKKRASMLKRKSTGSVIKPPKMKPKSKEEKKLLTN